MAVEAEQVRALVWSALREGEGGQPGGEGAPGAMAQVVGKLDEVRAFMRSQYSPQ